MQAVREVARAAQPQPVRQRQCRRVKAVITDHHYTDIGSAMRVLRDAGIECVVGACRSEDEAIALGRDADAVINQHVPLTARVLDAWPRCRGIVHFGKGVDNIDVDAATQARHLGRERARRQLGRSFESRARTAARLGARSFRVRPPRPRGRLELSHRRCRGTGWPDRSSASSGSATSRACLRPRRRGSACACSRIPVTRRPPSGVTFVEPRRAAAAVRLRFDPRSADQGDRETDRRARARADEAGRLPHQHVARRRRRPDGARRGASIADASRVRGSTSPIRSRPRRDDPLLALDNVILTPHVAWYSEESREHVTVEAAREVVRILRGERPRSPSTPASCRASVVTRRRRAACGRSASLIATERVMRAT